MIETAFTWPVRVYYEDTDTGGVVFYANYLKFFERARTEWLRSGGINQSELADAYGIMFVVMRTTLDYHAPAKLDNELKLTVIVERLGRASVEFQQQAWRVGNSTAADAKGGSSTNNTSNISNISNISNVSDTSNPTNTVPQLLATGRIKVACVDRHDLRPRVMPEAVRQFIKGCC